MCRMTCRQLRDWQLFFESEPWGSEVDNVRSGWIAMHMSATVSSKPVRLRDYVPPIGGHRRDIESEITRLMEIEASRG